MQRRALLAALGAGAVGLAGCTDGLAGTAPDRTDDSPTDPDTRRLEMGGDTVVSKQMLKVANPRVHPSVLRDAGAWRSLAVPDGQFVVVDVTTGGPMPDRPDGLDLRGTVDGEPVADGEPVLVAEDGAGGPFDPGQWDRRSLAFPFPAAATDRASIRWSVSGRTVRWPLGEAVRTALAAEPAFRLSEAGVRRVEEGVELALTVANDGARDARFQARVSFETIHDASSVVALDVPAGGTTSYRAVPPILTYDGIGTVTLSVREGGERRSRDLPVPERERPTGTGRDGTRATPTPTPE
jgi:hypothetical protein